MPRVPALAHKGFCDVTHAARAQEKVIRKEQCAANFLGQTIQRRSVVGFRPALNWLVGPRVKKIVKPPQVRNHVFAEKFARASRGIGNVRGEMLCPSSRSLWIAHRGDGSTCLLLPSRNKNDRADLADILRPHGIDLLPGF